MDKQPAPAGERPATPDNPGGGTGPVVLAAGFFVFGVVLLALTTWQTKPAPPGKLWSTEPALAPVVSLVILAIPAGLLLAAGLRALLHGRHPGLQLVPTPDQLRETAVLLEFAIYFVLYVWLVDKLGYLLSSFLFAQVGCWRLGLRGWRTVGFCLLLTLALVGAFRFGLRIWFPGAAIYEYLPAGLRNFALQYL